MSTEYGLKRHFTGEAARLLGELLRPQLPDLDVEGYAAEVDRRIPGLELKDRVLVLAEGLRDRLPAAYPDAVVVLLAVLGDELGEDEGMFTASWFLMPVARFVEEYGLDHPDVSLPAIREITRRHTGEYAIRPYVQRHYAATMAAVTTWARDASPHVRRLASEGIRPRLPWARTLQRFVDDPAPVLEVLEVLRSDPSAYVRKSVANNLNDIARDHPDLVLDTATRWSRESPTPQTEWIVKHALRVLVKKGDQHALALLGTTGGEHIRVHAMRVRPRTLQLGEAVSLQVELQNTDSSRHSVAVDYVVHHVRRNGRSIPKVFKLATVDLGPGERCVLEKVHRVREVTTRAYYPGEHRVDVQVNGLALASDAFELRT